MATPADPHSLIDGIERLIQVDVGRNINALFDAAKGGLWAAACALAGSSAVRVGLITGFYVPLGSPPAAETDGPVGAALLAKGFEDVGVACRLASDEPCRSACSAALAGAGAFHVAVDADDVDTIIDRWRHAGITHAISIERCGRSADGAPRNMRGLDISSYTAPLDELFAAGPWETIAVGDGGNEIGMGYLPRQLIAQHVEHGETMLGCLDETLDKAVLEATVVRGPAVDGVSRLRAMTVDNLALAIHHKKLREIRALAETVDGV